MLAPGIVVEDLGDDVDAGMLDAASKVSCVEAGERFGSCAVAGRAQRRLVPGRSSDLSLRGKVDAADPTGARLGQPTFSARSPGRVFDGFGVQLELADRSGQALIAIDDCSREALVVHQHERVVRIDDQIDATVDDLTTMWCAYRALDAEIGGRVAANQKRP